MYTRIRKKLKSRRTLVKNRSEVISWIRITKLEEAITNPDAVIAKIKEVITKKKLKVKKD